MEKQATPVPVSTTKPETEKPATEKNINLGKRKKSEPSDGNSDGADDLDSVIMSEPRKKIQKLTHSNTIDGKLVEKKKSEIILEPSFVQSKIACACGSQHTITLSNDGTLHSFGRNNNGELGLGHNKDVSLPTPIPNLPQINMISCGADSTVCVDHEGFIWSFGDNYCGQLGTGNTTNCNVPQKIQYLPPVLSVSCGYAHTLIITNDSDLWSWGRNKFGQLCHGDREDRSNAQKTSFSNISKLSGGFHYSLFQNSKGKIFSCGCNRQGQCGLGHFLFSSNSTKSHSLCTFKYCKICMWI